MKTLSRLFPDRAWRARHRKGAVRYRDWNDPTLNRSLQDDLDYQGLAAMHMMIAFILAAILVVSWWMAQAPGSGLG